MLKITRPKTDKRSLCLTSYAGVTLYPGITLVTKPEDCEALKADKHFLRDQKGKNPLFTVEEKADLAPAKEEDGDEQSFDQAAENARAVKTMKVKEAVEYIRACAEVRTLFAIWRSESEKNRAGVRKEAAEALARIYGREMTESELTGEDAE